MPPTNRDDATDDPTTGDPGGATDDRNGHAGDEDEPSPVEGLMNPDEGVNSPAADADAQPPG